MEINGGINYTVEALLWQLKELQKYQQGVLPCKTRIQTCAAELHHQTALYFNNKKIARFPPQF